MEYSVQSTKFLIYLSPSCERGHWMSSVPAWCGKGAHVSDVIVGIARCTLQSAAVCWQGRMLMTVCQEPSLNSTRLDL